jgi:uncharacterized protein YegP (UPF0339 family)
MKKHVKRLILSLIFTALAALAGSGCVTMPGGQRSVSPEVLASTESVVCAGVAADVMLRPQDAAIFHAAKDAVDSVLATNGVRVGAISNLLRDIPGGNQMPWLAPAIILFDYWVDYGLKQDDTGSARAILDSIRNGLACAVATAPPQTVVAPETKGRVELFKDISNRWRWRRIAANGQIVSIWGESSRWKWNCKRSATKQNPGLPVLTYR